MAQVIDIHTHMFSDRWVELIREHGDENGSLGPNLEMRYRGGSIGRVSPAMLDWDGRIRAMDKAGVDVAVISLTAPNVYWGGRAAGAAAARAVNQDFAAAERRHDGRIRWMASLPWQHAEDAVAELRQAQAEGAVGIVTLTNIAGTRPDDPRYEPIWREIEAMGLPVFIHPTRPAAEVDFGEVPVLANAVGFTFDTTLCFARMIFSGFLDRFPRLRMIACHGGGALPFLSQRFGRAFDAIPQAGANMKEEPAAYLRRLHYDAVVYDQPTLDFLIATVGAGQVLYGSDYPFMLGDMAGCLARVDALPAAARDQVRGENARRLFNLG
ncbi:MAG TPA: amidohydrolase family protein [Hyphomicrobiales bacterium]|nr:amidohydrolase family protein [Hyphomicrobiales bacterium]